MVIADDNRPHILHEPLTAVLTYMSITVRPICDRENNTLIHDDQAWQIWTFRSEEHNAIFDGDNRCRSQSPFVRERQKSSASCNLYPLRRPPLHISPQLFSHTYRLLSCGRAIVLAIVLAMRGRSCTILRADGSCSSDSDDFRSGGPKPLWAGQEALGGQEDWMKGADATMPADQG